MNKDIIIKLVKEFKSVDYKDLVGALAIYEIIENEMYYETELEELNEKDIKTLENIYNEFMNSKTIKGLLNDELVEIIESEVEENENN